MIPVGILAAAHPRRGGGGGDPHWSSVASLMHFDGPQGGQVFTDEAGGSWAHSGPVEIDSTQFKFSGSSARFSGGHLQRMGGWDFAFGEGDFTIELWLRGTQFGAAKGPTIFDSRVSSGAPIVIYQSDGSSALNVFLGGADRITTAALPNNTWLHLALCRGGGISRFFVDGGLAGSYVDPAIYGFGNNTAFRIGRNYLGGSSLIGWVDEFRITNGVARYVEDFVPPSEPFPDG